MKRRRVRVRSHHRYTQQAIVASWYPKLKEFWIAVERESAEGPKTMHAIILKPNTARAWAKWILENVKEEK